MKYLAAFAVGIVVGVGLASARKGQAVGDDRPTPSWNDSWRTVTVRPDYEWWGPTTSAVPNFVRTWTEETH